MIHSYKGGCGKTILSVNLANQLAQSGKQVLLIEGDLEGPVLARNLPDVSSEHRGYLNQYLRQPGNLEEYITPHQPFDVVLASPKFNRETLLQGNDYYSLLNYIPQIREELHSMNYDVIIFDLSPGVNYFAIASVLIVDAVIIVLRPDKNSYSGTQVLIDEVYKNVVQEHKRDFHLVINQLPPLEQFNELITEWKIVFKHQFPFITHNHILPFDGMTSYNTLNSGMILPENDALIGPLKEICSSLLD
jgi:MinD-like ATPase involved in chromosome partitioning or flagellar assembly